MGRGLRQARSQFHPSMTLPQPTLLVITDGARARRPLVTIVAEACAGGCRWIMVREKYLPREKLAALVTECQAATRGTGAIISVNSDIGIAVACGADGIHLPSGGQIALAKRQLDGIVGVSAHNPDEVRFALAEGADYVTLSPIFASSSKPGYGPALGLAGLRDTAENVAIPIVALGGIDARNARRCLAAGAAGVAVMGAVMTAQDSHRASADLVAAVTQVAC